ncbi:MAG: hypothetical protein JSV12_09260 [Candidatus Bathyarchaeota archaeon]|nr:MAG: hypothetical protein JSV12_09260 [Candidatus Bathyarchaeota archaeon]
MAKIPPTSEKVPERKTVVYKTLVDPTAIKIAGERIKTRLFTKFGFLKPRPEEIQNVSIEKNYEPYFLVDGEYAIDYYRKRYYTFNIEKEVQEVIILNKTLKPDLPKKLSKTPYRSITLEGEERLLYKNRACLILDKAGREVDPKRVPAAPSEERPKKALANFRETMEKLKAAPDKEIAVLRSRILRRPPSVERVVDELFKVSERSVIYVPVYKLTFKNVRTGEVKNVKIDGVTGRRTSW